MSICLVAIFKNESHILNEFIKHYINQGIEHFFFIDNGSNDEYSDILNKFNNITLKINPNRPFQLEHYNNYFLEACKKYDWVIICDLDEFIYARLQFKNIKEYLNSLDDTISQVFIPWKLFGSSGFNTIEYKQPNNVIENFTKRTNYDKNTKCQGVIMENNDKYSFTKCIVKTKYLKRMGIHSHDTTNKNYIGADNNDDIHNNMSFYKINEDILSKSFLHLNHYAIQSYEWFMKIKATRGDATSIGLDGCRNTSYYRAFDICCSDICDFELKLLNSNL
jgi:hypothetical protein